MQSALLFSVLSSMALLTTSASVPQPQIDNTPPTLDSTPTPTSTHASSSMTGTPATNPSLSPGDNNNGVSSVPLQTILAVVLGVLVGLGLLAVAALVLLRVSGKKRRMQVEAAEEGKGKAGDETDGESVFTECEKERVEEGRRG